MAYRIKRVRHCRRMYIHKRINNLVHLVLRRGHSGVVMHRILLQVQLHHHLRLVIIGVAIVWRTCRILKCSLKP